MRSSTVTRGSLRSDHASWPRPTSTATTCAAPPLQQAVGEAAGRRAGVERAPAVDVDAERVERAPRASGRRATRTSSGAGGDRDRLGAVDLAGRAVGRRAADRDAPGRDRIDGACRGSRPAPAAPARRRAGGARQPATRRRADAAFVGRRPSSRRCFLAAPSWPPPSSRPPSSGAFAAGVAPSLRSSRARSSLVAMPSDRSWRWTSCLHELAQVFACGGGSARAARRPWPSPGHVRAGPATTRSATTGWACDRRSSVKCIPASMSCFQSGPAASRLLVIVGPAFRGRAYGQRAPISTLSRLHAEGTAPDGTTVRAMVLPLRDDEPHARVAGRHARAHRGQRLRLLRGAAAQRHATPSSLPLPPRGDPVRDQARARRSPSRRCRSVVRGTGPRRRRADLGRCSSAPSPYRCRPARTSTSRCSCRCSCTAPACTCSATCCSSGSSATTSKTASDRSRFAAFYLVAGVVAARRRSPLTAPQLRRRRARRVGRDRRRDGRVPRLVPARAHPDGRVVVLPAVLPARLRACSACWFVLQFLTNPNSGVAWMAHVGGFAFGALVALVAARHACRGPVRWRRDRRRRRPGPAAPRCWMHRPRRSGAARGAR